MYLFFTKNVMEIRLPLLVLLFTVIYIAFLYLATLLTDFYYLDTQFWYNYSFLLTVFIFFIGLFCGKSVTKADIGFMLRMYVIATAIFSVVVFATSLTNVDFSSRFYEYSSKNSAATIILVGIIVGVTYEFNSNAKLWWKLGVATLCIFEFYAVMLLRSRATIICIPVAAAIILMFSKGNAKARWAIIIALIVCTFLLMNESIYDTVVNNIIYANRDVDDLNDLTSGRSREWENFWTDIGDNWWFGIGGAKRESFILNCLLELGFIIGGMMLVYVVAPLFFAVRKLNFSSSFVVCFFTIGVVFCTNGIFEGQSPLGPGVKCFMYWFMYGMFYSMQDRKTDFSREIVLKRARIRFRDD